MLGTLSRWDDDKGFGFISSPTIDEPLFVHISAFASHSLRPQTGDAVSFKIVTEKSGRLTAKKARLTQRKHSASVRITALANKAFTVFAALFALALFPAAYIERISWLLPAIYLVASIVAFAMYAWDKRLARKDRWRTPESSLLLAGLLCGWPGALLAQRKIRHKSSKISFLRLYWLTVIINVAATAYLIWIGQTALLNQAMNSVLIYLLG